MNPFSPSTINTTSVSLPLLLDTLPISDFRVCLARAVTEYEFGSEICTEHSLMFSIDIRPRLSSVTYKPRNLLELKLREIVELSPFVETEHGRFGF